MKPLFFSLPGNETMARRLSAVLDADYGQLEIRRFPDEELYLRYQNDVTGRSLVLVCTLDRPDEKLIMLYLASAIARELGAAVVGLVAPYLAYMRQDARFHPGEGISSMHVAHLLSGSVDWIVTVDPHLHRFPSLSSVYSVPAEVAHAAPAISAWIRENVASPVVIGPDRESEQWAAEVAGQAGCQFMVLEKIRRGDRDVEVSVPNVSLLKHRTPVLVDDIASTARTMIAAVRHLHILHAQPPVCIAVHPVFAGDAYFSLLAAGATRVVSCNTIVHESNGIDVAGLIAARLEHLFPSQAAT